MRYLRAKNYIEQVIASTGPIAIGYEEVRRHRGVSAAHVYGGIVATLQQVCEARGLPYRAIPVGTVKKIATGKGNADKDAMIAAAKRLGYYPETDDEADAIFIALALEKELTT
jgi:Holliday junction resolvasome RuvABC endonuclease subunit